MTIDYNDLLQATPEAVQRLARALGLNVTGLHHTEACSAVMGWYRRNPAPPLQPPKRRNVRRICYGGTPVRV